MIRSNTQETFNPLARPRRQVHVIIYIYIYIYINGHTHRQASKSIYHARPLVCRYGDWLELPRTRPSIHLRAQGCKSILLFIYIYTDTYKYIHTHTHTPASTCTIHGSLSAVTSNWLQLPRTRISIHLRPQGGKSILLYIHTHTYILIHKHTDRPAIQSTTHSSMSAVTAEWLLIPRTRLSIQLCAQHVKSMLYIYIYTHTNLYIYTHTYTGQQIHLPRTAPCLQLRRNDCKYHARGLRTTCEPKAASPYSLYIYTYTHIYIYIY
jgi:hypothetical protein